MKRALLIIALLFAALPSVARIHGLGSGTTIAYPMLLGGAGNIIGVSGVPSQGDIKLGKTDQYGCYAKLGSGHWRQLITPTAMPVGAIISATGLPLTGNSNGSCDEAIGSPSNNDIWVGVNGSIFFSTDRTAFNTTCYPAQGSSVSPGNIPGLKGIGHLIAVDPANPNIIYMSTPASGLEATYDKGSNCFVIGGVSTATGTPSGAGHIIVFDNSGGTTATCPHSATICTKNIYVCTNGHGVYKSTDAAITWTLTTSTPTTCLYMVADPFGNIFFLDNANNNGLGALHKFNGTAWSVPAGGAIIFGVGVDVDPNACPAANTCHIGIITGGGTGVSGTAMSTDGAATFNVAQTITFSSATVPWIADAQTATGIFPAGGAFDNLGQLWTGGEGPFKVIPPTIGSSVTFTSDAVGVEESLSSSIVTSANTSGKALLATWDLNCFLLVAPFASYPTTATNRGCYSTNANELQHTYNTAWASANPSFFVALTDNQQGYSGGVYHSYWGKSSDGGITWSSLSPPAAVTSNSYEGGCIAASTTANYLVAPTDGNSGNVAPYYTLNGGTSWTQITVSGVTQGWPWRYYLPSKVCDADRVLANTFYIYNWNDGVVGDAVIKCTSGGASCTEVGRPGFGAGLQFAPILKTAPDGAGHLFLGYGGGLDAPNGGFAYSTDGGVTYTTDAAFKGVAAIGLGVAAAGHTYSQIVIVGFRNGVYGVWRSIDWDGAKTWQQIATYPYNWAAAIQDIDGDKVIPGVFYLTGTSGSFCLSPSINYCSGTL